MVAPAFTGCGVYNNLKQRFMKQIIDPNLRLTEHFTLGEMLRSETAERLKIPNVPLKCHIERLRNLCVRCLEPTRQRFKVPIQVSSGYRCEPLNSAVGGATTSQHLRGEAADIVIPRRHWPFCVTTQEQMARILFDWMKDNVGYDQLILEHHGASWWVHVSCRIDTRKNRQQILMIEN